MVFALPAARLADALRLWMSAEMHVRKVDPEKEGLAGLGLPLDEIGGTGGNVVVDRFHPLFCERAGVVDGLPADPAEALVRRRVIVVGGLAVQYPARTEPFAKVRKILRVRVIGQFRLFLGIQVVEVAEELVETVDRRQIFIAVAEVVLADLPGRISQWLQELGDGRVQLAQTDRSGRQTDFGQPGAQSVLAGNERGSPGGAALLAVAVGESHALLCDAVDIRRAVTHHPVAIATEVCDADVIPPDDENIWFLFLLCHIVLLSFLFFLILRCKKSMSSV